MGKNFSGSITLASKGIFYDGAVPNGVVQCEPWGTVEERLLLSPTIEFDDALDRLFKTLTDLQIPAEDLLVVDRQHLFFYIRCLSVGEDFDFKWQCDSCGETNSTTINLEKDLDVIHPDHPDLLKSLDRPTLTDITEPFYFSLPLQGKRVGWRMLRGKDEKRVRTMVMQGKKRGVKERQDYIIRLALRIVEIDGEKIDDIFDAIDFIESLRGKDSLMFQQEIEAVSIGVNPELQLRCSNCGFRSDVILPIDRSFFRPKRKTPHG